MDISRPHTAVLNVRVEIHALDDMGQCSGQVLSAAALEHVGLKPAFLLSVSGKNANECIENLRKKLEQFNE